MLDYGVSGLDQEDWIDHIKPKARGGSNDAKNGITTSWSTNFVKGANGRSNKYWFVGGRPTWQFYSEVGAVPKQIAQLLRRDVKQRDWYFNRSVRNLLQAVHGLAYDSDDPRYQNPSFYPKAALRFLNDFRREWRSDYGSETGPTRTQAIRDWKLRGLLPVRPSSEQKKILDLLDLDAVGDIGQLAGQLVRPYQANWRWLEKMDQWTKACDLVKGKALVAGVKKAPLVSPLVREFVKDNVVALSGLPKADRDERQRDVERRYSDGN
jgi:hypothetical protein